MKQIVPSLYNTTKIWGPPGTGKTTRLLKILKEKLDYGYSKEQICLVGYARATATTLQLRCKNEFNFNEDDLNKLFNSELLFNITGFILWVVITPFILVIYIIHKVLSFFEKLK